MIIRLHFSKNLPVDFTDKEKKILLNFDLKPIPNKFFKEYEYDTSKMGLFRLYTLLVKLGYKNIKLLPKKHEDYDGIIEIFRDDLEYYDEIIMELK